ncbi:UNVERIFIED_CONTAM: MFS transporter, partial [Pseudomonas aeruginosa]
IDAILPALDEMAADLNVADGNRRQLVIAVYTITMGIGCLVPGAFADRFGRRPIVLFGLAAYTSLSLVTSLLTNFEVLLWVRGLAGLMAAGLM